eukprot:CAMPEP_0195508204 /NCGR_PEP_ID=MMETSP0794_2-20130614/1485_1 /TAXON_ID=515487 /ORGANISM="Stephanopyxis turris, Strain CCMP 815" /LENGTH=326 /DNA_ID=CAMNT_0040635113 /DNA_START=114 /DNA_END=1095 /DNA_ORIENTATION=+
MQTMLQLDANSYKRYDYLAKHKIHEKQISGMSEVKREEQPHVSEDGASHEPPSNANHENQGTKRSRAGENSSTSTMIDIGCRLKICEWSYRVVDYFGVHRGVVSTAWSFIDRFLATQDRCNTKVLKIAAMAALHLADKICGSRRLSMKLIVEMSAGEFSLQHLQEMEIILLRSLKWYVHPPTSACFIREFMTLLTGTADPSVVTTLSDFAHFFAELSVCDYYFVTQKSPVVAVASVLNALNWLSASEMSTSSRSLFLKSLSELVGFDIKCDEVKSVQERLWECYTKSEECKESIVHNEMNTPEQTTESTMDAKLPGPQTHRFVSPD